MSNWRIPALVLLALIAAPIAAIAPEYWSPRHPSHQPPPHADDGAARKEQQASKKTGNSASAAKVVEPTSTQDERRPATAGYWQKDAQEALARYTLLLTCFTFILAVATVGLVVLAIRQWRDSRILQRAYLSVEPLGVEPFEMDGVAHISVRNVGKLPARSVSWSIDYAVSPDGKRDEFPIPTRFYGRNVVPSGTEMKRSQNCRFSEEELDRFKLEPRIFLYVWGEIRYLDGFGKSRWTKFCHRYDHRGITTITDGRYRGSVMITADSMRYHQYGNDADEGAHMARAPTSYPPLS